MNLLLKALGLALLVSFARTAAAEQATRFDQCLGPVRAALAARNANVREIESGFLLEGESAVHEATVGDAGGCLGFLAVGARNVRDLDLSIYTTTGTSLVEDVATNAHPYVRFCGAPGLPLRVVVRMYQGQGAYRLVPVDNAPTSVDRLDDLLGPCAGPEETGTPEPPPDLGPEPAAMSLDESARRELAGLRDRGYVLMDLVIRGEAAQGQGQQHRLDLASGDCYAVLAVGDRGVTDLDMTLLGMTRGRASRDAGHERTALVRICPDEPAHMLEVRAYRGGGGYRIHVLRLVETPAARAAGIDGVSRVFFGEWTARAAKHAFATQIVTWASIAPGEPLAVPIRFERGRCYAIGAVPAPDFERGDIDVVVTDSDGRLLTWDVGPDNSPMTFYCADTDGDAIASLRLAGAARSRVLMLMATDQETTR
jgi:hypothetical protein